MGANRGESECSVSSVEGKVRMAGVNVKTGVWEDGAEARNGLVVVGKARKR